MAVGGGSGGGRESLEYQPTAARSLRGGSLGGSASSCERPRGLLMNMSMSMSSHPSRLSASAAAVALAAVSKEATDLNLRNTLDLPGGSPKMVQVRHGGEHSVLSVCSSLGFAFRNTLNLPGGSSKMIQVRNFFISLHPLKSHLG